MNGELKKMQYCKRCTYPIIAVNLSVGDEGVCSGCVVHDEKMKLDWDVREKEFVDLLNLYKSKDQSNYDCIIPVSGGKDSHYQTWYVKKKLGLNPLLVTYYTHNYTTTGEENLKNISAGGLTSAGAETPGAPISITASKERQDLIKQIQKQLGQGFARQKFLKGRIVPQFAHLNRQAARRRLRGQRQFRRATRGLVSGLDEAGRNFGAGLDEAAGQAKVEEQVLSALEPITA